MLYHDLDQYTHYMMHDFVSHCYHGPVIFPVVFPDSVEGGIPYTSGYSLMTCRKTRMDNHFGLMPGILYVVSRFLVFLVYLDYVCIPANCVDLGSSLYPTGLITPS